MVWTVEMQMFSWRGDHSFVLGLSRKRFILWAKINRWLNKVNLYPLKSWLHGLYFFSSFLLTISALGGKLALYGDKHANMEVVSDEIDKFISDVQVCVGRWNIFLRNFLWNIRRLLYYKSYELQYYCDKWLNGCSLCKQLPRGWDLLRRTLIAFSAEKFFLNPSQ